MTISVSWLNCWPHDERYWYAYDAEEWRITQQREDELRFTPKVGPQERDYDEWLAGFIEELTALTVAQLQAWWRMYDTTLTREYRDLIGAELARRGEPLP
jgi:hypothetical protein